MIKYLKMMKKFFFIAIYSLFYVSYSSAIYLDNEKMIKGIILEKNSENVKILTPYSILWIPSSRVAKISSTVTMEEIINELVNQKKYKYAKRFVRSLLKYKKINKMEFYKYEKKIDISEKKTNLEKKLKKYFDEGKYEKIYEIYLIQIKGRYKDIPKEIKNILCQAFLKLCLFYLDHINYDESLQYFHLAVEVGLEGKKLHSFLVKYAQITGNKIVLQNEKRKIIAKKIEKRKKNERVVRKKMKEIKRKKNKGEKDKYRGLKLLLQAYNAGPTALLAYRGNVPYKETINFVKRVLARYNKGNLKTHYDDIIKKYSAKFGLSENLIKAILLTESSGSIYAVSNKNARGLMQIKKIAFDEAKKHFLLNWNYEEIFDPEKNIYTACAYLAWLKNEIVEKYFNLKVYE